MLATPVLAADFVDPLAPKQPHFPAKVKSVIWLHQAGAPSTLDLYDYKPELIKLAGQEIPPSFLKGLNVAIRGDRQALRVQSYLEAIWGKWSMVF